MKNLLLLVCLVNLSFGQTIKGTVFDGATKEPIPFASIGIKGKTLGTVCDENGNFELSTTSATDSDSLKISSIGYKSKCFIMSTAKNFNGEKIQLTQTTVQLSEVTVRPTKTIIKVLGNKRYNENIKCFFQGANGNYKGVEVAIKADNKKDRLVWIEDFNFYVNQCLFKDSIAFRLNFYKEDKNGMAAENILQKPIVFKIAPRLGIFTIDLKKYNINTVGDFFISLECLSGAVDNKTLAFSGGLTGPTYFKLASFSNWEKAPLPGLDFNVTVTYQK